ncbi:LuxR C-terminal-related transcriptional regulator [Pseudomonas sp. NPDC090755]|uniref:LuxR C-terminal-related transcriptional regulator n=1 Tax=Pseudomonas sp. NPDC090755 TaxID=3364481 RepID=UPI00383AC696
MPDALEHHDSAATDLGHTTCAKVLHAKLSAPIAAPSHLVRAHLLDTMGSVANARLILLRAAAGFGKTTLLLQYRERCLAAGRRVLWLNLDKADNDIQRLITHLLSGIRDLCADDALEAGSQPASVNAAEQLQELLERVSSCVKPFSIVLDEFEAIENPSVLDFVQRLMDALPPCGVLVIASRTTPDIGLGRLRARGQLVEINPAALRFTLEEATRFIREKRQLTLRDNEIATLFRCTEGWITAIYLASLSLQGRTDPAAFVASFSGSNQELAQYLAEDILARQSEDCRLFLMDTSILEQLNAPLCDAVTGRNDSQAMIEHLERSNLFIFPLDNEHQCFRYHSLFASYLKDALNRQFPGRAVSLHHAAAQWHFSADRPIPAIEHLLQAGATAEAASRLALYAGQLMADARSRLLLSWLDRIPQAYLELHPNLNVAYAWALALHRRYRDALKIVEQLEGRADQDTRERFKLEARTIRCMVLAITDQVDECYLEGLEHIEQIPLDEVFQYGVVTNSLAFSMLVTGRHEEARHLFSQAYKRSSPDRVTYLNTVTGCIEGVLDLTQGRLGNALARLQAAAQCRWTGNGNSAFGGKTSLDITLSLALYESDALEEVEHNLCEALPHAKDGSPPDSLISSHVLLARIAYLKGERDTWLRYLAELEQIGRQSGSDRVMCSAWLERARIATLENRLDAAAQALRSANLISSWDRPGILFHGSDVDTPSIARLRLQIAQGACVEAASQLQDAIAQADERQHYRRKLKLCLLLAMALDGAGQQEDGFAQLTQALRFASHEGFLRTFLDEGARLADVLQRWAVSHQARASSLGIETRFLTRLLQRAGNCGETCATSSGESDAKESLTTREIQVIQLLAAGLRNRAIAQKMFLSEFTVKSHLRNINAKLGAQGRTEAVAIARAKGLLD